MEASRVEKVSSRFVPSCLYLNWFFLFFLSHFNCLRYIFATQRREQAKSSKELLSSILFTNSNFFHSLRSLSPFIPLVIFDLFSSWTTENCWDVDKAGAKWAQIRARATAFLWICKRRPSRGLIIDSRRRGHFVPSTFMRSTKSELFKLNYKVKVREFMKKKLCRNCAGKFKV